MTLDVTRDQLREELEDRVRQIILEPDARVRALLSDDQDEVHDAVMTLLDQTRGSAVISQAFTLCVLTALTKIEPWLGESLDIDDKTQGGRQLTRSEILYGEALR